MFTHRVYRHRRLDLKQRVSPARHVANGRGQQRQQLQRLQNRATRGIECAETGNERFANELHRSHHAPFLPDQIAQWHLTQCAPRLTVAPALEGTGDGHGAHHLVVASGVLHSFQAQRSWAAESTAGRDWGGETGVGHGPDDSAGGPASPAFSALHAVAIWLGAGCATCLRVTKRELIARMRGVH